MTTRQEWCRAVLYSPSVLLRGSTYRMWYIGSDVGPRRSPAHVGLAESEDGIRWRPYAANPILRASDIPWGSAWQTPHVLFDQEEGLYKMWFVMSDHTVDPAEHAGQKLGYATSEDGLRWEVHPEAIYPSARRPCVLKDGPGAYRMWMNSAPEPGGSFQELASHIYRFESEDGVHWKRDVSPAVTAGGALHSVVYPFVLRTGTTYVMWYGAHVGGGVFEIFCSTSEDGFSWTHHHEEPAFPASRDPNDFDGRYTSTPCVVKDGERWLLYYSARDWGNLYATADGRIGADGSGVYRHIGVAVAGNTKAYA
jgi:hypothetical protein